MLGRAKKIVSFMSPPASIFSILEFFILFLFFFFFSLFSLASSSLNKSNSKTNVIRTVFTDSVRVGVAH